MRTVSSSQQAHVLIVDADLRSRSTVATYLQSQGFLVSQGEGASAMRAALERGDVDLVLLDVVLPGEDGLRLAREVAAHEGVGMIMLTSRANLLDRVIGLELGADDYIAKPFHPRELLARIRSVLRRLKAAERARQAADTVIVFDGWRFDRDRRELVNPRGRPVPLTTGEFNLLATFLSHPGRVLDRDQLMDITRGRSWEAFDRTIDAQVARLRKKIENDPKRPRYIQAVRGVGYVFAAAIAQASEPTQH